MPHPHPRRGKKNNRVHILERSIKSFSIYHLEINPAEKEKKEEKCFGKHIDISAKYPLGLIAILFIINLFVQPDCQYNVKLNNELYYLYSITYF